MMSHTGPKGKDTEGKGTELDDYMEGYFEYVAPDRSKRLLHIAEPDGQAAVKLLRKLNGKPKTWSVETLAPEDALVKLMKTHRSQCVRQHGGFGKNATLNLTFLVEAELEHRRQHELDMAITAALDNNPAEEKLGTPSKKKITVAAPDEHGISYPTAAEYHAMSSTEKSKTTRKINALRKKNRLEGKWTPPDKPEALPSTGKEGKRKSAGGEEDPEPSPKKQKGKGVGESEEEERSGEGEMNDETGKSGETGGSGETRENGGTEENGGSKKKKKNKNKNKNRNKNKNKKEKKKGGEGENGS
jgi:hypothetical protein